MMSLGGLGGRRRGRGGCFGWEVFLALWGGGGGEGGGWGGGGGGEEGGWCVG